mgnify:FL=1
MIRKSSTPKLGLVEMAGLILTIFEKNEYCANQISAVLELINHRFEEYRNLEPIHFENINGKVKEIRAFEEAALNKHLLEYLKL